MYGGSEKDYKENLNNLLLQMKGICAVFVAEQGEPPLDDSIWIHINFSPRLWDHTTFYSSLIIKRDLLTITNKMLMEVDWMRQKKSLNL